MKSAQMKFSAIKVTQGSTTFYVFTCKASVLWSFAEINQRKEDKDEGYQRVLSTARVNQIRDFLVRGNAIPGAIIISCDHAKIAPGGISIAERSDAAWIIDGQHRCAGANKAAEMGYDVDLPVVAFLDLTEQQQADYFVTINREAKGVPSSLYIDLLRHLPKQKTEKERLEERIADISHELSRNMDSILFRKIVSTTSPKSGEISLTNFARRLRPLLHPNNGILAPYTFPEQVKVVENFFSALQLVFPRYYARNIFFKTLGFGAVWRAFPVIFAASLKQGGFRSRDAAMVLQKISDFDFDQWNKMGTGAAAETQAGDDLIAELKSALESDQPEGFSIKL